MQNNNQKIGLSQNPYINKQENVDIQNPTNTTVNANPYINNQAMPQKNNSFDTGNFLKGALVGAIGAYLLTNEDAQKKIFKTFAKGADLFGAGMEEMKERMEDAKAELEAEREAK